MATEAQAAALEKARAAKREKASASAPQGPINLGLPSKPGLNPVGRTIKMFRPTCSVCEAPDRKSARWWEKCRHNPYIIDREIPVEERVIEVNDEGEREIVGKKVKLLYEAGLSMREVQHNQRVNAGQQVERERRLGAILPEEFRSPDAPQGYAPFCQFQECWSQNVRVKTDHGDYCRPEEARLIAAEERGIRLEVHDEEKRAQQLQEIAV